MHIDMVVFDMAGTTVDDSSNAVARCVVDAVNAHGGSIVEADVDPVMGMPKPLAVRTLLEKSGVETTDELVGSAHAEFRRRAIDHYRSAADVREMPGATETFRALRSMGVRVTLDTGFDREIADTIIERLGWGDDLVDDSITSDQVEHGRPAPDMIKVLMEAAGVSDPRRVAKCGDSVSDIEQGINAGCGLVVAMLCDRTRRVLHRFPSVRSIDTISEFTALLTGEPAGTEA